MDELETGAVLQSNWGKTSLEGLNSLC